MSQTPNESGHHLDRMLCRECGRESLRGAADDRRVNPGKCGNCGGDLALIADYVPYDAPLTCYWCQQGATEDKGEVIRNPHPGPRARSFHASCKIAYHKLECGPFRSRGQE